MKLPKSLLTAVVSVTVVAGAGGAAYAATTWNSQLTQAITAGVASTSITNASNADIPTGTASFPMSAATVSTAVQTTTGTFGTAAQRITVDNPGAVTGTGTWTLALNATTPGTGVWTNGTNTYPYNGTTTTGQLRVTSAGTVTALTGTTTGVTGAATGAFSGSNPINIMAGASTSDDIWRGYITGIGLAQDIPANTPVGSYTLPMTQTLTTT